MASIAFYLISITFKSTKAIRNHDRINTISFLLGFLALVLQGFFWMLKYFSHKTTSFPIICFQLT